MNDNGIVPELVRDLNNGEQWCQLHGFFTFQKGEDPVCKECVREVTSGAKINCPRCQITQANVDGTCYKCGFEVETHTIMVPLSARVPEERGYSAKQRDKLGRILPKNAVDPIESVRGAEDDVRNNTADGGADGVGVRGPAS